MLTSLFYWLGITFCGPSKLATGNCRQVTLRKHLENRVDWWTASYVDCDPLQNWTSTDPEREAAQAVNYFLSSVVCPRFCQFSIFIFLIHFLLFRCYHSFFFLVPQWAGYEFFSSNSICNLVHSVAVFDSADGKIGRLSSNTPLFLWLTIISGFCGHGWNTIRSSHLGMSGTLWQRIM